MCKIFVLVCLTVLVGELKSQRVTQTLCTDRQAILFDEKLARLLTIGDSQRKFPESKGKELKQYCDESLILLREIDEYRKTCLNDLAKQVSSIMVFASKSVTTRLCKKESPFLDRLIEALPCANQGNKQEEIKKCYNSLIDSFLGVKLEKDDKKKIPHLCCAYVRLGSCVRSKIVGLNKCSDQKVDTLIDFVNSMMGGALDLVCGDYTGETDKCDSLGMPPKRKKSQKRPRSFAYPMIEILTTFPEV